MLRLVSRTVLLVAVGLSCALVPTPCSAVEPGDRSSGTPSRDLSVVRAHDFGPGPVFHRRHSTPKTDLITPVSVDAAIEECVERDMAAVGAPGAAVTVIHRGDVIFSRGFGSKRWGGQDLVDSNTRFRIGSITKTLTAAAVMQQIDAGVVDLDDPVTKWVPQLSLSGQWPADTITVRHLLTHSSAIPDYYEDIFFDEGLGDWAAGLGEVRLHAPPGTFWNYSNPAFSLAGLVAERASGIPFRELMATRIFAPAGMSATTFDPAEVIASGNYTYGYHPAEPRGIEVYAPDDYDSEMSAPAGMAFSTAGDLAAWALLLMDGGGSVLSLAATEAMQARQIYIDYYPDFHYGLGVFAERYKGLEVRQHGGNIYGWGGLLLWVPEERFVVSVLDNTTLALVDATYCIVDAVLGPETPEPPDYSTDPETWNAYTGTYLFMDNSGNFFEGDVEMLEEGFVITFPLPDDPTSFYRTDLEQLYLDTFIFDGDGDGRLDFDLTFIEKNDGWSRTMWLRNRSFVGHRIPKFRRTGGRRVP